MQWDIWDMAVEISQISRNYLKAGRFIDTREKVNYKIHLTLRIIPPPWFRFSGTQAVLISMWMLRIVCTNKIQTKIYNKNIMRRHDPPQKEGLQSTRNKQHKVNSLFGALKRMDRNVWTKLNVLVNPEETTYKCNTHTISSSGKLYQCNPVFVFIFG